MSAPMIINLSPEMAPIYRSPDGIAEFMGVGRDAVKEATEKAHDCLPYLASGPKCSHKRISILTALEYFRNHELGS